jgi:PleD family two-component response regulator
MSPSGAQHGKTEKRRMLVVDDEVENSTLLRRMFRGDYEVEVATSGTEALSLLERKPFDVIISDQRMPGMHGTELLSRSMELCPNAVRILMTAFPDISTAISSLQEGRAYRFFTKPVRRDELVEVVSKALQEQRAGEYSALEVAHLRAELDRLRADNQELSARLHQLEHSATTSAADRLPQAAAELLRGHSPYDPATGLYSAGVFVDLLARELGRSERYGLVCSVALLRVLDVAPDAIDAVMARLTELLQLALRGFDCAARWSVTDFAVMLPHTDLPGAEAAVRRLHDAIGTDIEGLPLVAAAIAVYPTSGASADDLIMAAEAALSGDS